MTELFRHKIVAHSVSVIFIGLVIVFPFVSNPASVNWEKDLSLSPGQVLAEEATVYLKSNFPVNIPVYYAHPYLNITLNTDPFDGEYRELKELFSNGRPPEYLVVWDSWFSKVENGISLEQLEADSSLRLLKKLELAGKDGIVQLVIFGNAE